MRLAKNLTILVALASLLVSGVAMADEIGEGDRPIFSLTPYVGMGLWDDELKLDNSFIFGGRAAIHFLKFLSVEGTYGRTSADFTDATGSVDIDHLGADLVVDLLPSSGVNPYLTGGWGQLDAKASGDAEKAHLNGWEAGVGVKIHLGGNAANHRNLRLEVRNVMVDLDAMPGEGKVSTNNLIATAGLQFAFGKSHRDTDGDGVEDGKDACTGTPAGALVDAAGCPLDSDGDGVFDGIDQCDDTPDGATVDAAGCPRDSDGDGVFDGLDKCSATPAGALVDASGCPLDSDGDGVFDGIDQCPDTASNLQVDMTGCPIAITETEIQLLDTGSIVTSRIVFKTNSADLDGASIAVLDEIGSTLVRWPTLKLEIGGHTDSSGSAEYNQSLSERRVASVLDHLVDKFAEIKRSQFTTVGYGESNPVADNETVEGRAQNRRVEFKVLNTDELKKEIEKRKMLER